ncbi:MAG: hydrolase [Pseudolysinimonas sp.]
MTSPRSRTFAVELYGFPAARGRVAIECTDRGFHAAGSARDFPGIPQVDGTAFPGFMDSHVHLGLIERSGLGTSGITRVLDLGWDPIEARQWAQDDSAGIAIEYAGAFITAPGGYPVGRVWAPPKSTVEVSDAAAAEAAVQRMSAAGASVIKVSSNSVAGPVHSDEVLATIVSSAHEAGLPVVAHTEGPGEAARVARAGVSILAHAPFSETLSDVTLLTMVDRMTWISTLDIHGWGAPNADAERAEDNLRRFAQLGGRVRYGTDLGNGDLPVGVNLREVAALARAGLSARQVIDALLPAPERRDLRRLNLLPGSKSSVSGDPAQLQNLSVLTVGNIEEYLQ